MIRICSWVLRITFEIAFKWLESLFNVRIRIRILWITLEGFKFAFKWLESLFNDRICIWMVRISFEWFIFAFEWFEFLLTWNGSNLHSNASNPFQMIGICIRMHRRRIRICSRMLRIKFEWLEFAFKCFICHSKGWNLHSNG